VARDVVAGPTDYHRRSATVDAYYALVLECRDALHWWGFNLPRRDNMHAWVRLRLTYAGDTTLQDIGKTHDTMSQWRNRASYDLHTKMFSTPTVALIAI
jgi:hypothetical protein